MINKIKLLIFIVFAIFAAAISIGNPSFGDVSAQDTINDCDNTITVLGEAEIKADPDVVKINFAVETFGKTAQEALEKNKNKMNIIIDGLKSEGIASKDIQTLRFNVEPQWEYSVEKHEYGEKKVRTIKGYRAINSIYITSEDIKGCGNLIDKTVSLGANYVGNIKFCIKDNEKLEHQLLELAVKNARKKAETLASAASTKITGVMSIKEIGGINMISEYAAYRSDYKLSTPIEPGQITLTTRIEVKFLHN